MTSLEHGRVRLRPFEEGDAQGLFSTYSDAVTARYLSRPALTEFVQAEQMVAKAQREWADGTSVKLAIERMSDGAFLGNCFRFNIDRDSARAEIGYTLMRAHWKRATRPRLCTP